MACARAAYVAGFATTSNLAARQRYGVPTAGTSAHSFTLLHDTEADAFRAQVTSLGVGTTLLVDTYDVAEAVRLGVEIAGPELGAVRLDSGDLGVLARAGACPARLARGHPDPDRGDQRPRRVRHRRARVGARSTATASAPSSSPAPATRPAAWSTSWSPASRTSGGASWCRSPRRAPTRSRSAGASSPCADAAPPASPRPRSSASASPPSTTATTAPSSCRSMRDGEAVGREPLDDARDRHTAARAELPLEAQQLSRGEPVHRDRAHLSAATAGREANRPGGRVARSRLGSTTKTRSVATTLTPVGLALVGPRAVAHRTGRRPPPNARCTGCTRYVPATARSRCRWSSSEVSPRLDHQDAISRDHPHAGRSRAGRSARGSTPRLGVKAPLRSPAAALTPSLSRRAGAASGRRRQAAPPSAKRAVARLHQVRPSHRALLSWSSSEVSARARSQTRSDESSRRSVSRWSIRAR